jgi:MoxR-like ATPase
MTNHWRIFKGNRDPHDGILQLPAAPPWRRFHGEVVEERKFPPKEERRDDAAALRGATFKAEEDVISMVNAALYLRRPLLITGRPGSGKSSLIDAVAYELKLGEALRWPITSRTNLRQGLYEYDALGRLQEQQFGAKGAEATEEDIGKFIELGPLGTALLPTGRPRALLIDEIDKGDVDFPNDLLNVLEEGRFHIPELARLKEPVVYVREYRGTRRVPIRGGQVECREFPLVVLTSNSEREFPSPFLRRCIRLNMPVAGAKELGEIVKRHLGAEAAAMAEDMIRTFAERSKKSVLATDQLLNSLFLLADINKEDREVVLAAIQKELAGV